MCFAKIVELVYGASCDARCEVRVGSADHVQRADVVLLLWVVLVAAEGTQELVPLLQSELTARQNGWESDHDAVIHAHRVVNVIEPVYQHLAV